MDRRDISAIAHRDHPIAAPLGGDSVARLLDRALPRGDERVLDLGCGSGAWIARALEGRPGLRAEGVDIDPSAIAAAHEVLAAGVADGRIVLKTQDAKEVESSPVFDLVLCVGSTHAFGGLLPTLEAARGHLGHGGHLLVGDGFWEREPDEATIAVGFSAEEFNDLATTIDLVLAAGWAVVYGHVSTVAEWDDYEFSWTGSLSRWALDHPDHPDHRDALEVADEHRTEWLTGYRGTLGFVTLLLRPMS